MDEAGLNDDATPNPAALVEATLAVAAVVEDVDEESPNPDIRPDD